MKLSKKNPVEAKPPAVKVQPYPISCTVQRWDLKNSVPFAEPPISASIIRLEEIGFVVKVPGQLFRIGEYYLCDFQLPVFKVKVQQQIRVIKTVESSEAYHPGSSKESIMTVEFHFKELPFAVSKEIRKFMHKIGQKKVA